MTSLTGKVALVTGGSRGIGAAASRRLAAEGASVAVTYNASPDRARAVVEAIRTAGGNATAIPADLCDKAGVESAVAASIEEFGSLDILVNNAGVFPYGHIGELTWTDYEHTMAVHVGAVFAAVRAALPHLPSGGRIISIGSSLVERVPGPGLSLYSMSKAALVGFTKGLARDLGPQGINVMLVHPGSTNTDMNPEDGEGADAERELIALGRYAQPDDIASAVAFLAGPGGDYITGSAITVDGGMST